MIIHSNLINYIANVGEDWIIKLDALLLFQKRLKLPIRYDSTLYVWLHLHMIESFTNYGNSILWSFTECRLSFWVELLKLSTFEFVIYLVIYISYALCTNTLLLFHHFMTQIQILDIFFFSCFKVPPNGPSFI